jgi:hypothetical protein
MRQIYEQAQQVIIWLGELTAEGILGMKLLQSRIKFMYRELEAEKRSMGSVRSTGRGSCQPATVPV